MQKKASVSPVQDLLICIEMAFAAVVHKYTYTYK